ncbi:MAG: thiol peroxidase [Deltaproteobacteria bacterium]|nr:thiol peroxidase [Candidatus Anaeroferrophillus wilburensis]MBN2888761.1 thiol peroxidase [Deltaproteobacteria bacterium]
MIMEKSGLVAMGGSPVTLLGPALKEGDSAPEFKVVDADFKTISLHDFKGRIKLISVVPSLDTPICELQTQRFNQEAEQLPADVSVLTISMDLPFAQSRFCGARNINRVQVFSDYKYRSFGYAYGVMIKEMMLLARAIFLVDKQDVIRYQEICHEVKEHPRYYQVLKALRSL